MVMPMIPGALNGLSNQKGRAREFPDHKADRFSTDIIAF
jgi:hypothetical protein